MVIRWVPLRWPRRFFVWLLSSCGGHPRPTGEVFLGGKATDVHADFTQNHQGGCHVDPVDQGQVHTQRLEQRARRVEPDVVEFHRASRGLTACVFAPARLGKLASSASICWSHSVICR